MSTEEFCYIHLLKRKFACPSEEILNARAFYFTDRGYFVKEKMGQPPPDEIKTFSFYPGFFFDKKEKIINEYRHNWSIAGLRRRLSVFLFKYTWGRKLLKKE